MEKLHVKRNYADDASVATQAVATANLVSMLDPDKVDAEGVELIASATGTDEEFVENLTTLVDEANEAVDTIEEDEVIMNYSNKVRKLVSSVKIKKNFADEQKTESEKLTEAAAIVSMVDSEALDCCESKEIAETITAATGANEIAVEAIVELAKDNFSNGVKYANKKMRKMDRQNFAHLEFAKEPEPKAEDPVVDSSLPVEGSEGLEQNPDLAKNDPTPETAVEDLSAAPAGEAMAVQNELATVQDVTKVPEAESNFSRSLHKNKACEDDCSMLRTLLGDSYIA